MSAKVTEASYGVLAEIYGQEFSLGKASGSALMPKISRLAQTIKMARQLIYLAHRRPLKRPSRNTTV